jgi:uncharacterized membrane protein YeaQ/YmgE (transglycosylase-associated protein family)
MNLLANLTVADLTVADLTVADLTLSPGGVLSWIGVGLMAGWLAGLTMSGGGYGVIADIVLGLIGAVVGGIVTGFFVVGDAGFWASLLIAFIGACMVIAVARFVAPRDVRHI